MMDFNAALNGKKTETIEINAIPNLDPDKYRIEFSRYDDEIKNMQIQASEHVVDSDESAEIAVGMVTQSKGLIKKLDAAHKKITEPFHKFKSTIDQFRKQYKDHLLVIERIITPKLTEYSRKKREEAERIAEEERKRQAEIQKKLDEEAEKNNTPPVQAAPVVIQAPPKIKTETGSAKAALEWVFEVEDISQVPAEYLLIDEQKIKHLIKAGMRSIPGIRIFQQEKINYRSK